MIEAVDLPEIAHGLVVRPGDTLVIAVPRITTLEQADRLKEGVAEHLPGVRAVVVEANQLAVYRPGDSDPAGEPSRDAPEQHDQ